MSDLLLRIKGIIDKAFRRSVVKNTPNLQVKKKNISIISSNCNGGVLAHDLKMRFNSPFVNLWMKPGEYIKMLDRFEYYMSCDLSFTDELGVSYPVGKLGDVKIYFQHYTSVQEAEKSGMSENKE